MTAIPPAPSLETLTANATHYFGKRGAWSYAAFVDIRRKYFDERLPVPQIQWAITGYGACIGQTKTHLAPLDCREGPVVTLHPSLLGGREREDPWGIDPSLLGYGYAYEVLLHELIHVNIHWVLDPLGEQPGSSSHNSDLWVGEVNRLAPLLGLGALLASRSKARRVKDGNGGSRVVRSVEPGAVDFWAVATFPASFRKRIGALDFYREHQRADSFGFAL